MRKRYMRVMVTIFILMLTFLLPANAHAAAKKVKIQAKNQTVYVGVKNKSLGVKATKKAKVTFKSSKRAVLTVDKKGRITAKKAGTAKVTIKASKSGYKSTSKTIKVKVVKRTQTIKAQNQTLKAGEKKALKASAKTALSYKSSNSAIVTVSKTGTISAVKAGSAKIFITAKATSKYKEAKKTITVSVLKNQQSKTYSVKAEDGTVLGKFPKGSSLTVDPANGEAAKVIVVKQDITLETPKREAYEFSGWKVNGLTITASWTKKQAMIYDGSLAAPVLMDTSYAQADDVYAERTYNQIRRAVEDFRQDVAMVNGAIDFEEVQQIYSDSADLLAKRLNDAPQSKVPALITDVSELNCNYAVIVGAIGRSELIGQMVDNGKLEEARSIQSKSEAFVIKEVDNPLNGIKKALVIAGSDARGTVYGIYEVSENIGVSPWYWFSDVPVEQKDVINVDYAKAYVDDGPSVAYRGIFINDEEQLREWAYHKYGWPNQVADPGFYCHVFELLLRLKANTLWPAMHEGTMAFNSVAEDDSIMPVNAKNAAEYGIIMSASHCEMMLRNNVGEWDAWQQAHKDKYNIKGNGQYETWDYTKNKTAILAYWEERVQANQDYESIFPVGLRGVHDGGPRLDDLDGFISREGQENGISAEIVINGTSKEAKQAALMKDVINEQRKLIKKYYGSKAGAPQVFIPYKEMNTYYNMNNRDVANWLEEEAPDIIILWSNDNFSYLRQTPNEQERAANRKCGVYYHNSYWGYPKSWLWLNSASVGLMNSEMRRAYNTSADDYWILNVGDIKPGDISAEYFLRMAWDIEWADDSGIADALGEQLQRDYKFSDEDRDLTADCLMRYYQYNNTKRAEFYGQGYDFSITANGDEGMLWVNQWNELVSDLENVYHRLPENAKDAFYEQILYAVKSSRDVAEEYIYFQKNQLAVKQGRYGSAAVYRQLGLAAIERIKENQDYYWSLNNGKWEYVINYSHKARYREGDGTVWSGEYQGNQGIILKSESDFTLPTEGEGIGAAAENAETDGAGNLYFSSLEPTAAHYFDVFGKAARAEAWYAETPEWVQLSKNSGSVYTEERIQVTVDWKKAADSETGEIRVYHGTDNTGALAATFQVQAVNTENHLKEKERAYQEANGYVMIEAEHWSRNTAGQDGTMWQTVNDLSQRGDGIRVMSADGKIDQTKGDISAYVELADYASTACVAYDVYFEKAGSYKLTAYRVPTLDEASTTCRTYVGVNGNAPTDETIIRGNAATSGTWANNILRMVEPLSVTISVQKGWNTIQFYRASPSMAFDRFLIITDAQKAPAVSAIEIGMPVSPNHIAGDGELEEFQLARIAVLPDELEKIRQIINEGVELKIGDTKKLRYRKNINSMISLA